VSATELPPTSWPSVPGPLALAGEEIARLDAENARLRRQIHVLKAQASACPHEHEEYVPNGWRVTRVGKDRK
jgi:hypothetical protein